MSASATSPTRTRISRRNLKLSGKPPRGVVCSTLVHPIHPLISADSWVGSTGSSSRGIRMARQISR